MAKKKGSKKTGGRQKGVKNKSTLAIKDLLDSRVDWKVVVDKLFELVKGVTVQKKNALGEDIVYEERPDSNAAKVLLAYRFGQPKQEIDVQSGGQPIKQNVIKLADGPEIII